MKRKLTIRVIPSLYDRLWEEYQRYGYRSLSAYVCKLLKERQIIEISGGNELASAIHKIQALAANEIWTKKRREELCQLYDSLMIEIERLRSCVESYIMRHEEEQ